MFRFCFYKTLKAKITIQIRKEKFATHTKGAAICSPKVGEGIYAAA